MEVDGIFSKRGEVPQVAIVRDGGVDEREGCCALGGFVRLGIG